MQESVAEARRDTAELLSAPEPGETRAALERISDTPGLEAAAIYYLGQIANLERQHEEAIVHLKKALQTDPNATGVHYPLAQAYRALGQNDLAREHLGRFKLKIPKAKDPLLDQLHAATKRSLPAFQKAITATREGEYATVVERFAEGLAVDPDNLPARVSYARALYLAGRADDAGAALEQTLQAKPDELLANFLVGVLKQQQGDAQQAADYFRRTLSIDLGFVGALFYLANLDFLEDRYAYAAAGYAKALAADQKISPARLLELIARLRAGEAEADIAMASWMAPPSEREAMNREFASYAKGEVPAQPWPEGDPLLSPPPFDPMAPFRDYLAAVPY